MRYCRRCTINDQRPGIKFDANGICFPCLAAERAKTTDWSVRYEKWKRLCEYHREKYKDLPYDCVLPCSGGKDSTVQAKRLLDQGMRPLAVTVSDWFGHTRAGEHNYRNMCGLGMDGMVFRQDPTLMAEMVRVAFDHAGCPTWPIDAAIYSVPLRVAKMIGVELVIYGENIAYQYGGPGAIETPHADRQQDNDVVKPFGAGWWQTRGVKLPEWLTMPTSEGLTPIYQSYYFPWDGHDNMEAAIRLGFRTADGEWDRQGCIENYDQIDSLGYMVHPWLKYPKYGHQRVTDVTSNWIRAGRITRDEGVDLVLAHDHKLDPRALDDFLAFSGIGNRQFWAVVSELYNPAIFDRYGEKWLLRDPIRKIGGSVCHVEVSCGGDAAYGEGR